MDMELIEKGREIDEAVQKFQQELSSAQEELETIERIFPSVLAKEYMGYARTEANKIRRRRKQLITFIEESALIKNGFEVERTRLGAQSLLRSEVHTSAK